MIFFSVSMGTFGIIILKCLSSSSLRFIGLLSKSLNLIVARATKRALRESLRTHKVFTKDQCFYLNYHKISIKSYVLDVY